MVRDLLFNHILDFIEVLYDCQQQTNFAHDRPIYAKDIVWATGWLIQLKRKEDKKK